MKGKEKKQNGEEGTRSRVLQFLACPERKHGMEERASWTVQREARDVMSPLDKDWWQLPSCNNLVLRAGSLRTEAHNGK